MDGGPAELPLGTHGTLCRRVHGACSSGVHLSLTVAPQEKATVKDLNAALKASFGAENVDKLNAIKYVRTKEAGINPYRSCSQCSGEKTTSKCPQCRNFIKWALSEIHGQDANEAPDIPKLTAHADYLHWALRVAAPQRVSLTCDCSVASDAAVGAKNPRGVAINLPSKVRR